jgi:quercetin dioxygenase-like cupin family protein
MEDGIRRRLLLVAASLISAPLCVVATRPAIAAQGVRDTVPRVVIDNPRVRIFRATAASLAAVDHGPAVIVTLEDRAATKAGTAVWVDDAAVAGIGGISGEIVVVQPRRSSPATPPAAAGSRPGEARFIGMSFTPIFENDRVSTIRARMEVGAREELHTHGSDTVVVHLSGGEIEDTADGKTVVNRWKRGDVEFEGLGTSHSARNIAAAVDVVLVVLKR